MIHSVLFDDAIKLWWDYEQGFDYGCGFKVVKDCTEIFTVDKFNISFYDLLPESEHTFRVSMLNSNGIIIKELGELTVKTLKAKKIINVKNAPYFAQGDGKTDDTQAIQQALIDCKQDEKVFLPSGVYMSGALDIKSNTELLLAEDAVIQGFDDETKYLPKVQDRFEGRKEECYRSLINIGTMDEKGDCNTFNVVIRGGAIFGGGETLRRNIIEREKIAILKDAGLDKEINPDVHYARTLPGRKRGRLIRTFNTKGLIISDCKLGNSPSWNLHFIYSADITTCGCKIISHGISNGDGWDPDSSVNCTIFDTVFDTGDDCVAIKSGKNLEGYLIGRPTDNVKVFDCVSVDGHGIALGSEMSGGVSNVTVWNSDFEKSNVGISIKTNEIRGGYLKNIAFYNFKSPQIRVTSFSGNNDGEPAPVAPVLENFTFQNMELTGIMNLTGTNRKEKVAAVEICGYPNGNSLKNLTLKNIKMKYTALDPKHLIDLYYVENVTLENIICIGESED